MIQKIITDIQQELAGALTSDQMDIEMFGNRDGAIYCTLEECCVSVTGGSTPSMKHEEYYGGEVPFIKSGDRKQGSV